MTIALSTRSNCDLCGKPASVTVDPDIFLCTECAEFDPESEFAGDATTCPPVPGRSPVTGMSDVSANAGGEHEEVAPLSNNSEFVETIESGTSPGACGTERELLGAQNSNSGGVLGNHKPGSHKSGEGAALTAGSGRAHNCATCPDVTGTPSCGGVESRHPGLLPGPDKKLEAGVASGPHDSTSPPVHLSAWLTAPATSGEARSPLASPPFSSNTPEASGTARKASSDPLLGGSSRNDSSRLVSSSDAPEAPRPNGEQAAVAGSLQRVPAAVSASNLDFETEVAALEAEWLARGIIMNATQFCVSVLSDNNSKSVTAGI